MNFTFMNWNYTIYYSEHFIKIWVHSHGAFSKSVSEIHKELSVSEPLRSIFWFYINVWALHRHFCDYFDIKLIQSMACSSWKINYSVCKSEVNVLIVIRRCPWVCRIWCSVCLWCLIWLFSPNRHLKLFVLLSWFSLTKI